MTFDEYEAMSDRDLVDAVCNRGPCYSDISTRKRDCPFVDGLAPCDDYVAAHPEFRSVLIQYCLDEDAAREATV